MVVVLLRGGIKFPCRTAKSRDPVVGPLARSLAIAPDEPVTMCGALRRFGVDKPRMLVRGMVHDEIQDDAHIVLLALRDHAVEIGERSIHGIDVLVVGDVVAEIHLRRRETWTDP